jgi:hypothetical protein
MEYLIATDPEEIQIMREAIRKTTEKALRSKKFALKFLIDAGILKEEPPKKKQKKKNKRGTPPTV